jgi:hypothetical protein
MQRQADVVMGPCVRRDDDKYNDKNIVALCGSVSQSMSHLHGLASFTSNFSIAPEMTKSL